MKKKNIIGEVKNSEVSLQDEIKDLKKEIKDLKQLISKIKMD